MRRRRCRQSVSRVTACVRLTCALAASLVAAPHACDAAIGCGQQLTLLGVTAGDPPIAWITEDIGGECAFSFLIQIAVRPDDVHASVTRMSDFAEWEWLARGHLSMKAYEPPEELAAADLDSTVVSDDARGPDRGPVISHRRPPDVAPLDPLPVVTAPPVSEAWHEEFIAHLDAGGSDAVTWNAEFGSVGILPPIVDGLQAEVVYAYSHGLYINYDISRVERLPEGYLLLLTSQPALGVHRNTMHGLLVVRERPRQSPGPAGQ